MMEARLKYRNEEVGFVCIFFYCPWVYISIGMGQNLAKIISNLGVLDGK